jgi:hypothetical protein
VTGHGEKRLDQAWQQPEALGDHAGFPAEAKEVFDDQAEALAPNQWNVSSMVSGDRFTHRSSMSMAANSLRNASARTPHPQSGRDDCALAPMNTIKKMRPYTVTQSQLFRYRVLAYSTMLKLEECGLDR